MENQTADEPSPEDNVTDLGDYRPGADKGIATGLAIDNLGADPQRAARAVQLSDMSKIPASVIDTNAEEFDQYDRQIKARITQQLLERNAHLREFALSHEMAPKVAANDWGQLDKVFNLLEDFAKPPKIQQAAVEGFAEGFKKGFGDQPYGSWMDSADIAKYRHTASWLMLLGFPAEVATRLLAGGIQGLTEGAGEAVKTGYQQLGGDPSDAERLARDISGMVEMQLTGTGAHGVHAEAPTPPKIPPAQLEAFKLAQPYLESGKIPPVGLHPEIDKILADIAKDDIKGLDELVKESTASEAREASPEIFSDGIRSAAPGNIAISADRIRELYGDKEPAPDDGILGWVPDLSERLRTASAIGGDIEIPLADYLAHVPEGVEHAELKDFIRVRRGGMTLDEIKQAGEREEAKREVAEEEKERVGPRMIDTFHGSPHEFEAFSNEKIGTGQGAQSYGYGHYLAEAEAVAKDYQDTIPQAKVGEEKYDHLNPVHRAALYLNDAYEIGHIKDSVVARKSAAEQLQRNIQGRGEVTDPLVKKMVAADKEAIKILNSRADIPEYRKVPGNLYKVRIKANKEDFLDHDKPIRDNPKVQEKVLGLLDKLEDRIREQIAEIHSPGGADAFEKREGIDVVKGESRLQNDLDDLHTLRVAVTDEGMTGEAFYRQLTARARGDFERRFNKAVVDYEHGDISAKEYRDWLKRRDEIVMSSKGGGPEASRLLDEAGIPGIKYLDQRSRDIDRMQVRKSYDGWEVVDLSSGKYGGPFKTKEEALAWRENSVTRNYVVFSDKNIEVISRNGETLRAVQRAAGLTPMKPLIERRAIEQQGLFKVEKTESVETTYYKRDDPFEIPTVGSASLENVFKELPWEAAGVFSDEFKIIADKLNTLVKDVRVHVVTEEGWKKLVRQDYGETGGFYNANYDQILIPQSVFYMKEFGPRAVLHEAVHSATYHAVESDPVLKENIKKLMDHVLKKNPKYEDMYGFTNEHEFLTEAMTNHDFQTVLRETNIPKEWGETFGMKEWSLKSAWHGLIDWIRQALDLPEDVYTALDAAVRVVDYAVEYDRALRKYGDVRTMVDGKFPAIKAPKGPKGPKEPQLPGMTRMEDRELFETPAAVGMLKGVYEKLQHFMNVEDEQNAEWAREQAVVEEQRKQTKEWKDNYKAMRKEVFPEVRERPDVSAARFLGEGVLYDEKLKGRPRLDVDKLTPEQQDALPKDYYARGGMPPDDIAGLFGYNSGDSMVESLINYEAQRKQLELGPNEMVHFLADQETERRMQEKHGDLAQNIMEKAQDQATSPATIDRLAEEVLQLGLKASGKEPKITHPGPPQKDYVRFFHGGTNPTSGGSRWVAPKEDYARNYRGGPNEVHYVDVKKGSPEEISARAWDDIDEQAGTNMVGVYKNAEMPEEVAKQFKPYDIPEYPKDSEFPIKKEALKAWAKEAFGKGKAADVSLEDMLRIAGKNGSMAADAAVLGNWSEAFQWKQRQYLTMLYAAEAKKFEKERKAFDRVVNQFSKRDVTSVPNDFLNWIHYILARTVGGVKRSLQNIDEGIEEHGQRTLQDFVDYHQANLRSMPVADDLLKGNFKSVDEMSVNEWRALRDSIKTIIHNGREEQQVIREGDKRDLNDYIDQVVAQIKDVKPDVKKMPLSGKTKSPIWAGLKSFIVGHLTMESKLNRIDRDDPKGLLNRWVVLPLASAANSESAMLRREAKALGEILKEHPIKDLDKKVDNKLFREQDTDGNFTGDFLQFTRRNVLGILQNIGNKSNFEKIAKGWGLKPQELMQWVMKHTEKEDWDRAQKIGDFFNRLTREADRLEARQSGLPIEKIPLEPITTPHGVYDGWYHPLKYDEYRPGESKKLLGKTSLEQEGYFRPTPAKGYQKPRTGYIAPVELSLDIIASRVHQMVHDISMREAIINADKVFRDPRFNRAIIQHFGKDWMDDMKDYLQRVANHSNVDSKMGSKMQAAVDRFSTNMVATLVGWNPHTLAKHTLTAAVNSVSEIPPKYMLKAVNNILHFDGEWSMGMAKSEELQRRLRNWSETIQGNIDLDMATKSFHGLVETTRQRSIQVGSAPIGFFDLASAVPVWLGKYYEMIDKGEAEGDAISIADRAVRRAHGSSAITNLPSIASQRGVPALYTKLYNFFSHMLNKQYELGWKASDTVRGVKEGDLTNLKKYGPHLLMGFMAYIVLPTMIEEMVTPYTNSDRDSLGTKAGKALMFTTGASWIGIRDLINGIVNMREPGGGLAGTGMKTIFDLVRDLSKGPKTFTKENTGRIIKDTISLNAALTGIGNAQVGKSMEFLYRTIQGLDRPKSIFFGKNWEPGGGDWAKGLTRGTLKERR